VNAAESPCRPGERPQARQQRHCHVGVARPLRLGQHRGLLPGRLRLGGELVQAGVGGGPAGLFLAPTLLLGFVSHGLAVAGRLPAARRPSGQPRPAWNRLPPGSGAAAAPEPARPRPRRPARAACPSPAPSARARATTRHGPGRGCPTDAEVTTGNEVNRRSIATKSGKLHESTNRKCPRFEGIATGCTALGVMSRQQETEGRPKRVGPGSQISGVGRRWSDSSLYRLLSCRDIHHGSRCASSGWRRSRPG